MHAADVEQHAIASQRSPWAGVAVALGIAVRVGLVQSVSSTYLPVGLAYINGPLKPLKLNRIVLEVRRHVQERRAQRHERGVRGGEQREGGGGFGDLDAREGDPVKSNAGDP